MIQIKVDDTDLSIPTQGISTLGDLVEYVKTAIDPDTIIVSLTKDDAQLSEVDWRNPISSSSKMVLNFTTGSKSSFVGERLLLAEEILKSFDEKIEVCAQAFKQLRVHTANTEFSTFLSDLNAFVSWMHSIFSMDENKYATEIEKYKTIVQRLEGLCLTLQNQQMSSSWWALGDSVLNSMRPLLKEVNAIVVESKTKYSA